jgi:hypothetical protein
MDRHHPLATALRDPHPDEPALEVDERSRRSRTSGIASRFLGVRSTCAGSRSRYSLSRQKRKKQRSAATWPAWTFANHKGVEPTNNHAERALRSAVIYRKLSLGSQSTGGERRIERLLSAHTTCRLQGRSLFAYLIELLTANARGDPVPTLA